MPRTTTNKKFRQLLASLLIAVFVFAPLQADIFYHSSIVKAEELDDEVDYINDDGYEYVIGDAIWHKGDHIIEKGVFINNEATLTIEKGANIVFKKTSDVDPFIQINNGNITAVGTQAEKIIFSAVDEASANFWIAFQGEPISDEMSFFRFVDFIGGGINYGGGGGMAFENFFINTAFASELSGYGTLQYGSGKVHLENVRFADGNYFSITTDSYFGKGYNEDGFLEIVNSNFEDNPNDLGVKSKLQCSAEISDCSSRILLKNNWYDDSLGPNTDGEAVSDGVELQGNYTLDGWRENDLIADPVVIVPGIMGSEEFLGTWQLDPITHTYADLVSSLEKNGFTKDLNLFDFPYEWRNNNETSAHYLQSKIEAIIDATKVSKVDVVAHSMGGLVARAYLEDIGGTNYENTIDQLITLGTPNKGSPEAYLNWEAGEGFFSLVENLTKHHFQQEAEHAGYSDLGEYIQKKIPSVKELLPDYDYLFDVSKNKLRNYFEDYPRNTFLEELNLKNNLEKLKKVDYTNIIGKLTNDNSTISKIRVVDSVIIGKWKDGMPENFYDNKTNMGLESGYGDETVPKYSAEAISANKTIEINASHQDLPDKAQCDVFKELTNRADCTVVDKWHITNFLLFNVFSPINIQIVSPSGKRVGKDFEHTGKTFNEIEGAFYSGYDSENEFITIPNPEDGKYTILTKGTGDGAFRVEATKISEDPVDSSKTKETVAIIKGTAVINKAEELKVEVKGNSIVDSNAKDDSKIPPTDNNTNSNNNSDQKVSSSDHNKSSHKKKKSHKKKTKKTKVSKAPTQAKKVLGISTSKNAKPKNVVTKSFNYVATKAVTAWQSTTKAVNNFKAFIFKPFNIFKWW